MLHAGVAWPSALEIVAHADTELAQLFDLELDAIAVLEGVQATMIGAARQDIARLQRMDRTHELDAARNLVRHVVGVEVLLQLTVVPQLDLELMRIGNLVRGHDVGADLCKRVARFALIEGVARWRQAARRAID